MTCWASSQILGNHFSAFVPKNTLWFFDVFIVLCWGHAYQTFDPEASENLIEDSVTKLDVESIVLRVPSFQQGCKPASLQELIVLVIDLEH